MLDREPGREIELHLTGHMGTAEVGFRFRDEFKRELAPYAGIVWHRKLFGTGDFARQRNGDPGGWHLGSWLRFWF